MRLSQRHDAARERLEKACAEPQAHPDLWIEYGLLLCLLQREDEALGCLEKGAASAFAAELDEWLAAYFHCRRLMAEKIGAKDAKGAALAKCFASISKAKVPKRGIRLSACLIVKNEEKHLERCLKSVAGHVDEIVVVDTGSTDRTLEIAQAFGAKTAQAEWTDDFSAARNISLDLASGDWALWIDADEEVAPESWGPIREGLIRPHFGGFFVRMINFMDEEGEANTYTHAPVRLFQLRPDVRFRGRVHEQVTPALDELNLPCARLSGATLYHYGYRPSDMEEKSKLDRTIALLEREVRESPEDAFHWFNLANAYSVARRSADAVHAAQMCVRYIDPANAFGSLAYQILASGLNALQRPHEALMACEEAETRGFHSILNQFEKAHALLKLARLEEALAAIETCQAMPWDESMTGDYGIVTHKARTLRGQILSELGHFEEAAEDFAAALAVDPTFPVARYGQAVNWERTGRLDEAYAEYETLFADPQFEYAAREGAIRILFERGDWETAADIAEANCRSYPMELSSWAGYIGAVEGTRDPVRRREAYQRFAEFHEPSSNALVNWSRALREGGEFEAAHQKLVQAIALDPENANAHFNQGDLLYACGLYADAAQAYESGLRIEPENAQGWFVLGNAFARLEVWEGARLAYAQTLELEPGHDEARANLEYVDEGRKAA